MKKPPAAKKSAIRRLRGTAPARKLATVVLEVLGGVLTPMMAATSASITLQRYYALEARALEGLIAAMEPRPKGRQRRPEEQLERVSKERDRLSREVSRLRALVRVTHRSAGLTETRPGPRVARRRRPSPRAARAVKWRLYLIRAENAALRPGSVENASGGTPPWLEGRSPRFRPSSE